MFLRIKRPISFQWIILGSLVFFSMFPILILEFVQVITIPAQLEQNELNPSSPQRNRVAIFGDRLVGLEQG